MFFLRQAFGIAAAVCTLDAHALDARPPEAPDKTVVLTFDDAVKSQVTIVAPLLKGLGFGATFFITRAFMHDTVHFMSWDDAAKLHQLGFEIGNHSWTHGDFGTADGGAGLGKELEEVEVELARVGIPKPISFAWCGNFFGPEGIAQLQAHGYKLARRGTWPEFPYGSERPGLALDIKSNHPLLIPTTGDFYPYTTYDDFKAMVSMAEKGKIVVLQFHGVPDVAHPHVSTLPQNFSDYMVYLKQNGYHVVALRDVLQYYDISHLPDDPMLNRRVSAKEQESSDAIDPKMRALFKKIEALEASGH